jgi:hypothetical protein
MREEELKLTLSTGLIQVNSSIHLKLAPRKIGKVLDC